MAVILVVKPNAHVYLRTTLWAINKAQTYPEMFDNLRLIAAILMADWLDSEPDLSGVREHIFDVMTTPFFYENGYAKTKFGDNDDRLWFCDYIGFEKITSQWAKENCPGCKGYICVRISNQNDRHKVVDNHTIQFYF